MESKHDRILRELAEIEESARAVMQGVSEEKKALAEEARQNEAAWDAELDENTATRIAEIRAAFAKESDAEIEKISAEAEAAMAALHENYEKQMDARAEEIVRGILAGGSTV